VGRFRISGKGTRPAVTSGTAPCGRFRKRETAGAATAPHERNVAEAIGIVATAVVTKGLVSS